MKRGNDLSTAIMMNGGFFVHKDLDTPIFRCIRLEHILDLLKNQKLFFHNILCWEDTWEVPSRFFEVYDAIYGKEGPASIMDSFNLIIKDLFGTCWTDNIDSDALWRIYSGPAQDGICIQTTVRKLFNSIDFSCGSKGFVDGFIGPVRYENLASGNDGQTFFDDISENYPKNMISSFIKRHAFEHEHEIRFLIHASNHAGFYPTNPLEISINNDRLYLPFKNLNFIDYLIADPRLQREKFLEYQEKLNFCGKPIIKSALYDIPTETFQMILHPKSPGHDQLRGAKWWNGFDFSVIHE